MVIYEVMSMRKGSGFAWGLSSVLFAAGYLLLPFFLIKPGSTEMMERLLSYIQILWAFFPAIAFGLAFIGKKKSQQETKARRLCNIGAGIGWLASFVLLYWAFSFLWVDIFSIPARAAEVICLIDTVLVTGYFLIAYICGKLLWFI